MYNEANGSIVMQTVTHLSAKKALQNHFECQVCFTLCLNVERIHSSVDYTTRKRWQ
jgi:hypothetical protein